MSAYLLISVVKLCMFPGAAMVRKVLIYVSKEWVTEDLTR
jgi:hypothetical protein